jgi:phosphoglycolate phosphatase/pyrophosphatase PpaX
MAVGLPLEQVVSALVGHDDSELVDAIRDTFLSISPRKIKLFDGVDKVLSLPYTKAILTSKGDLGTYRDLRTLGIEQHFDVIVTADTVQRRKPYPDGINLILKETGESRDATFMIGDTEMDILAGKRARVHTIAVAWGNRKEEHLFSYEPEYVARTPAELKSIIIGYAQR